MRGTNANTGEELDGIEHLRQSVRDILTTPIGSRVMLREYGSQLFQLIDAPLNRSTVMDFYAATAEALRRWEPRLRVTKMQAGMPTPGAVTVDIEGEYLPDGRMVKLDGIRIK